MLSRNSEKVRANFDRFSGEDGPPEVWPGCAPYGDYVPTSWKNVLFYRFFIRALKLGANHEKQVFTFFAFLPPYMGVSGSLVPRKR